MSRIKKRGLDYFPISTDFIHDRIVRRIMKKEGDAAVTVLVQAFCSIYSNEGYYVMAGDLFYDDLAPLPGGLRLRAACYCPCCRIWSFRLCTLSRVRLADFSRYPASVPLCNQASEHLTDRYALLLVVIKRAHPVDTGRERKQHAGS